MFLFDLAHARITAHNKKSSYRNYINALPLDRMVQIHVSREGINEQGLAYDAHEFSDGEVLKEAKEIIHKFSPEYVTIEYYKDKDKLIQMLGQYKQICQMSTSLSDFELPGGAK